MMNTILKITLLLSILLTTGGSFAKSFTSQYCQFELPNGWECALEGTEWVCQSVNVDRKKEAIIILAAKIRGPQDDRANYQAYLKQAKTFGLPDGKTQVSDPKYVKQNNINNHVWVDALHLASEVPGFYTRYMASTKEDLAIAVTFSVAKDHYDDYQILFDRIIATLRVFRQKQNNTEFKLVNRTDDMPDLGEIEYESPGSDITVGQKNRKPAGSGHSPTAILIYLLLAGIVVAGFMKLKNMKKQKKS